MKRLLAALALLAFASVAHAQVEIPDPGEVVSPGPGTILSVNSEADTTAAAATWIDTGGATFAYANQLYHKALYVHVSDGAAAGSIVFRIQGSSTGASNDWQNIYITGWTAATAGAAFTTWSYVDTLQVVLPNTGAPFNNPGWLNFGAWVIRLNNAVADGAVTTMNVLPILAPFPFLRVVVINRGADVITTTTRWQGSVR